MSVIPLARAFLASIAIAALAHAAPPPTATISDAAKPPREPSNSIIAEIPAEITSDKLFVPVRINNSDPIWFCLDTGDGHGFLVDRRCADKLNLPLGEEHGAAYGAGEGAEVGSAAADNLTFHIGSVRAKDRSADVVPLDHVSIMEGRRLNGVFGRTFLRGYIAELNYQDRKVILHDPKTFEYNGPGLAVPINLTPGIPIVRASITLPGGEKINLRLAIDSGCRQPLMLTTDFVQKHRLRDKIDLAWHGVVGGGLGGPTRGDVGRIRELQIGDLNLSEPIVTCSTDQSGILSDSEALDGILGGPALRRCTIFVDYPHNQIIFEPLSTPLGPFEYDMSGLFIAAHGDDLQQRVVLSVSEGSPAAEAGIKTGDLLLAIDDKPASQVTLDQLRDLLRTEGQSRRLEFQRGDQRIVIQIKLHRLV